MKKRGKLGSAMEGMLLPGRSRVLSTALLLPWLEHVLLRQQLHTRSRAHRLLSYTSILPRAQGGKSGELVL